MKSFTFLKGLCRAAAFIVLIGGAMCYMHEQYGESCKKESDCGGFLMCNEYGVCDCFKNKEGQFSQFYELDLGACFSRVGSKCSHAPARDHEIPFDCLPNGHCEKFSNVRSRFGNCICNHGFQSSNEGKQCVPIKNWIEFFKDKPATATTFDATSAMSLLHYSSKKSDTQLGTTNPSDVIPLGDTITFLTSSYDRIDSKDANQLDKTNSMTRGPIEHGDAKQALATNSKSLESFASKATKTARFRFAVIGAILIFLVVTLRAYAK